MQKKGSSEHKFIIILILVNIPFALWLANYPQDPDSAEMLMTAIQGGVLHPPGFPLQAWIDRLIYVVTGKFTDVATAYPLSLFSFILHIVNVLYVYLISRKLSAGIHASLLGSIFYSTYPLIMGLALQPDKYTMVQTIMFSIIYFSISKTSGEFVMKNILLSGFFTGLSLTHHPASAISALFWIYALITNISGRNFSFKDILLIMAIPVFTVTVMYASLPLLRNSLYSWPDWGSLGSLDNIVNHILRKDLGGIELNIGTHVKESFTGLHVLWSDILPGFNILLILPLPGILYIMKKEKALSAVVALSLISGFILLGNLSNFFSDNSYGYMERYLVFLYPFIFITTAPGIEYLFQMAGNRSYLVNMAAAVITAAILVNVITSLPYFRGMSNSLTNIYRKNISRSLGKNQLFISGSDFDTFYGVPAGDGTRYPVVNLFQYAWYVDNVLMKLDVNILPYLEEMNVSTVRNFYYFKRFMSMKNYTMVSTSGEMLRYLNRDIKRRGLLYSINDNGYFSNADSAADLCKDLIEEDVNIPARGHYFMRDILKRFSFLYKYVSSDKNNSEIIRNKSAEISSLLKPGVDSELWKKACGEFIHYVKR